MNCVRSRFLVSERGCRRKPLGAAYSAVLPVAYESCARTFAERYHHAIIGCAVLSRLTHQTRLGGGKAGPVLIVKILL